MPIGRRKWNILREGMNGQELLAIGAILLMGMLLIVRAHYGMDTTDETFYLATAKRFCDGDLLFKNDWNTAQIMGLLLTPLYRGYVFVHGSNEGIMLFSRILFVMLGVFTAFFLFGILRRLTENCGTALLSALCVLFYVRGNIINISYYSLGFYTFLLAVLWRITARLNPGRKWYMVLSGINFSVSVLCMPYMAVLYFLLAIVGIWKKDREMLWFSCGVFLTAAGFLIFSRNMIPWDDFHEYFPLMFQDPEMDHDGVFEKLYGLLMYYIKVFLRFTWPLYILTVLSCFLAGRRRWENGKLKKGLTIFLLGEFLIQSVYVRTYFEGGIIATFLFLVLQLQLLYPEYREEELEGYFLVPGISFGLVWIIGSNVGHRAVNMSFLLMDLWAISFLSGFFREKRRSVKICGYFPAYLLLAVLFIIRFFDVYRDGSVTELTTRISSGVMAGIYTEEQRADAYEQILEVVDTETEGCDTVAVLGCNPWIYMDSKARCGAYSTWKLLGEEPLLNTYYEMFPEKIPNIILILPQELEIYDSWKFSSHGAGKHVEEVPELEGTLLNLVEQKGYIQTEKNGVLLYRQP